MKTQDMLIIYDYNYWANAQILAAARRLSPEDFRAPSDFSFGNLQSVLAHTYFAERQWRIVCEMGVVIEEDEDPAQFYDLGELESRWQAEESAMREFLADLTDQDMTRLVRYTVDRGLQRERVLWHCLLHVVNHGTQHRSEAAELLTRHGHSPGDLDFTLFLLSKS